MKNIVVLSGAGISKESGLDTFRQSDGLWEKHRIEDVANFDSWLKDPDLVRRFYNERRKQLLSVEPNAAHKDLVRLEEKFNVNIVTQNVDNLHERAGSTNVLHLHGELMKACSVRDKDFVVELEGWELSEEMKDNYGEPLRPFIVFFGESVPMIEPAIELCQRADIIIVIGTSLNVYPAAGLLQYAARNCKKYLIDPNRPNANLNQVEFIEERASVGVGKLVERLINEN